MSLAVAKRRAKPPAWAPIHIPAPVGGLNTVSPAGMMPETDCPLLYNMIASEYGQRVRLGYREWVTGITGAADNIVRAVIPFTGSNSTKDKLFITTSSGIWDVSASTSTPVITLAFVTTTGNAGYGNASVIVTAAGHFMVYCDEVNGAYLYTESTNTWVKVAGADITGVDPANLVYCTVFKNRLWFVERDSARAWYLGLNTIPTAGTAATSFNMAGRFRQGGELVGLWSYTRDGGSGTDDFLVGVSRGGDIVIYQLADPSSPAGIGLQGVWYAGGIPAGRQIATAFGGDLLLLTKGGVLSLRTLAGGAEVADSGQYATVKVQKLFNQIMLTRSSYLGWSLRIHPEDSALMITAPVDASSATTQVVMSLTYKSWSQYRDLPIYSSEVWGGKLYFGTVDGKVCINDGYVDGVLLSDPNSYSDIGFSGITRFVNGGNTRQKQIQSVRTTFLSDGGTPSFGVEGRFRYSLVEAGTPVAGSVGGNVWDSGEWDSAVWGGDYGPIQVISGVSGMGPEFAIAFKGTARSRTVLVGMDVAFSQGGYL